MRKSIIGAAAVLMIVVMLGGDEVSAANGWEEELNGSGTSTSSSQTEASLQLTMGGKRIEGTLDAANASTNPDEAGKVLTEVATIVVGSTDGYTVAVSGNANLTGEKNSNHKIPSVTSAKTLGSMKNEWGYYGVLGDSEASWNPSTSFKGMSTSQQTVAMGGATTSNVTKKVTLFYGARVDDTIAEDFYGNTVTLSVVAQPRTVTTTFATFDGETTMQGMTAEKCKKSNVHDTKQLTDTRDGKKYWVTRMLDGNCWMSQNLDFDISISNVRSVDSDVASDWTTSSVYPVRATTTKLFGGDYNATQALSWDPGEFIEADPTGGAPADIGIPSLGDSSGSYIAVGDRKASNDPNFYNNNGNRTYTDTEYDAHYLAGNYYQWNAATAGTGGTITNANATGSICPKNWKLPNSGTNVEQLKNGSFNYLLLQYGLANADGSEYDVASGSYYDARLSPLFFGMSGRNPAEPMFWDGLTEVGGNGYYWSSRAYSTTEAYYLDVATDQINPSAYRYERYDGLSLRCFILAV